MRFSSFHFFRACPAGRSRAAGAATLVAAVAALLFPLGARADNLYSYTFSSSNSSITCCATMTYAELQDESLTQLVDISGTFVYDATDQDISSAIITLSTAPESNTIFTGSSMDFTIVTQGDYGDDYYLQLEDEDGDEVQFLFDGVDGGAASLNADSYVSLDSGGYVTNYTVATSGLTFPVYNNGAQNQLVPVATDTPTAYADPSPVPEPTSLALFVTALAGFAALRRRSAQALTLHRNRFIASMLRR